MVTELTEKDQEILKKALQLYLRAMKVQPVLFTTEEKALAAGLSGLLDTAKEYKKLYLYFVEDINELKE